MSYILYEGPSILDGKPIVAIITGVETPSRNIKTGPMAQVIYLRSDMNPIEAIARKEDISICGSCTHKGTSCYVNIAQGPNSVFRTYQAGKYRHINPRKAGLGQSIRLGSYGDIASVPLEVTEALLTKARMHTGYTHSYRERPDLKGIVQASADTPAQALELQSQGWKTFRTKLPEEPLLKGEIYCPSNKGLTCLTCGLCDGKTKNVAINVHGVNHKLLKYKTWKIQNENDNVNQRPIR